MRLVLLPGMDGTGELFAPLIKILPKELLPLTVAYPPNEPWGYSELLNFIRNQLPKDEDFVVLGESFSGPLALMVASDPPARMRALVLACTFEHHPRPALAPFSMLAQVVLRFRPPKFLRRIQSVLTNGAKNLDNAARVQLAIGRVSVETLHARIKAINGLSSNVQQKPISLPSLYLQALADRVVPTECYQSLQVRTPHLRLAKIEGPHCLLQVNPEGSVEAMVSFLNSTDLLK
jgi:pimeloyl-[acyl-carrier protein] methyl ester esterase